MRGRTYKVQNARRAVQLMETVQKIKPKSQLIVLKRSDSGQLIDS